MLVYEQHIVLEAGVEMRLQAQLDDDGVVVAVDMCVDAVQTLEHVPDERWKCLGEGNADARGEHGLVVDIGLYPCHEVFDVFGCGHLGRLLVVLGILPEVLKLVGRFHLRTALWRAELCDGAVEQVNLVVEVDNWGRVSERLSKSAEISSYR